MNYEGRQNRHTQCCQLAPVLRRVGEKLDYQCYKCGRKGGLGEDEIEAGFYWEESCLRAAKFIAEGKKK